MGAVGAVIILILLAVAALIWGCIRLTIWIIKTAVKEALREYDAEKQNHYGSQ